MRPIAATKFHADRLRRGLVRRGFPATYVSPVPFDELTAEGYSSQIGQDRFLDQSVFAGARGLRFVDVGAHDGVSFSNSLFFERERGWGGVCIEPNPVVFERLRSARSVTCAQCLIAETEGMASFRAIDGEGEMLSGAEEGYGRRQRRTVDAAMTTHGLTSTLITVPMRRLDNVLPDAGIDRVDLLLIDVEGMELDVLASIDLSAFGVHAVLAENNFTRSNLPREMRRRGYRLAARIGWDDCYVRV